MYELAIFDFDGTLADSAAWMRQILNELAPRHRFRTVDDAEVEELRGKDTRTILSRLDVSLWRLPFIARDMRRLVARDADRISLFPGVPELVDDLHRRGIVTAIVSSNAEDNVRRILGPVTASRIGHYACGAGLFGKRSKFRDVLAESGIRREATISIGDEVRDIEAAVGERLATGAVTWGYATRAALESRRPTIVFETLADVRALLLGSSSAGVGRGPEADVGA